MPTTKETIIYVTREIERALGITPNQSYLIVSNRTSYGESVAKKYPDFVTLVDDEGDEPAGTGELMQSQAMQEVFAKASKESLARPYILVFKNTARIEPLARERGWTIVNPLAAASEKIENKISQVMWLAELERFLPQHRIEFLKNVRWNGQPFIIQWAHGHTGGGTILVKSDEELNALKVRFPERRSRVSAFINGPSFTMNVVVTPDRVIRSSPSYQITGMLPFTDATFATIGNDWGLATKLLSAEDKRWINELADLIGAKMQKECWRGLFGIDVIKDASSGKLFLIEINARQPASTTFESALQEAKRSAGASGLTTFEAHIAALLGQPVTKSLIQIEDGAQIIQRVTEQTKNISTKALDDLGKIGLKTVHYENSAPMSDLVRIQSDKSIMSEHNTLGEIGESIASILKNEQ